METLVSNKNRVLAEFEASVNVDSTTVKEVKDLGNYQGVGKTEADEGGVAKEGGADRRPVGILDIP